MTNYGQSSYETPYSGVVPPGPGQGDALSDSFNNTRPEWIDVLGPNVAVPGFASVEAKWLVWDPGAAALMTARVNTRTQRAEYEAEGKNVSGYFQQIPVPATVGETIDLHIYGQILVGGAFPASPDGPIGLAVMGLMLGDDLLDEPNVSSVRVAGLLVQQLVDAGATQTQIAPGVFEWVGFDALPSQSALSEGILSFWRFRMRQTMTGADEWTTDIAVDAGTGGADWMTMHVYPQTVGNVPQRSAGFAVCAGANARAQLHLDSFTVVRQSFDDFSTAIGGVQQLGPV